MALRLSTEVLARASARRPWLVVALWVAAIAASGVAIVTLLASSLITEISLTNDPESQRSEDLLEERLRGPEPINEIIIVRSADLTVDDPQFRQFVEVLYDEVSALGPGIVASGSNFYRSYDSSLVSQDRHNTILPFVMTGDREDAEDNIDKVLDVVDQTDGAEGFDVLISGNASINNELQEQARSDLEKGESIGDEQADKGGLYNERLHHARTGIG